MSDFKNVKKFQLNRDGVRDNILLNPAISAECLRYAEQIAMTANALSEIDGAEYIAETRTQGRTRGGAIVHPDNDEATKDNLRHNTLEKAFRS